VIQALDYLRSDPVLWVKSDLWFTFVGRRMLELKNFQLKLSKSRPSNYGIVTSLIMHLIRNIITTPINTHSYLNAALIDLNFGPCIERFGMFFLHDIDISNNIFLPGLEQNDDDEVAKVMKLDQRARKKARTINFINSEPNAQYPIGDSPPWKLVVQAIQDSPETMLKAWEWSAMYDQHAQANDLFIRMTVDLWLTVVDDAMYGLPPKPTTLQEAMECWTVEAIQASFRNCTFLASSYNLRGAKTGQKHPSFRSMLSIFFPAPDAGFNANSVWQPLMDKGYIGEYHHLCKTLSERRLLEIKMGLGIIFAHLQCLPVSKRCQEGGRRCGTIWKTRNGYIELVTNSRYYKLARIGNATREKKAVRRRVKASTAVIAAKLDQEHRGIPYKVSRREYRDRQKSWKKANFRKPPARREEAQAEESSVDESDGDSTDDSDDTQDDGGSGSSDSERLADIYSENGDTGSE
jgi:hypothetical protein